MRLLTNRVFVTILFTDLIQQLAIWVRNIAILFFVMELTNRNPLAVSALNFIELLPMLFLTFIGGMIADRYHPRKLMLAGDFLSTVSFLILGLFIQNGFILAVFAATFISAIVTQFSAPSSQKYFKKYVDEQELDGAIGMSQLLSSFFVIIGPAIGSFFYFTFGIDRTIMILAVLFFLSFLLLFNLPKDEFEKVESGGFFSDIMKTFHYIQKEKLLALLIKVFFVFSIAIGIAGNLDIFLVTVRLGLDEKFYQFFSAVAGVGMLIGGGCYIWMAKKFTNTKILPMIMGVFAVTIFFEGYSTVTWLTVSLQFIDNVLSGVLDGYVMTMMTKATEQAYLGKVNGCFSTIMYLGIMIGYVSSGILVDISSIVVAYAVAGVAFIICTIFLYQGNQKGLLQVERAG